MIAEDIKVNATSWSIGMSTAKEVDDINILRASLLAEEGHRWLRYET